MAIIICGFPGVGKSCVATNRTNILDAESSAFSWIFDPETAEEPKRNQAFPGNYVKHIKDNMDRYEFIMVSTHKQVLDAIEYEGLPYIIVAPQPCLKNEYLIRYLQRGSTIEFIELLNEKWESFLADIGNRQQPVIWLEAGQYMSDILGRCAR